MVVRATVTDNSCAIVVRMRGEAHDTDVFPLQRVPYDELHAIFAVRLHEQWVFSGSWEFHPSRWVFHWKRWKLHEVINEVVTV